MTQNKEMFRIYLDMFHSPAQTSLLDFMEGGE